MSGNILTIVQLLIIHLISFDSNRDIVNKSTISFTFRHFVALCRDDSRAADVITVS